MKKLSSVALVVSLFALPGCCFGGTSPTSGPAPAVEVPAVVAPAVAEERRSCMNPIGQCEWTSLSEASEEALQTRCTELQGTFAATPCPDADRLGSCRLPVGTKEIHYYSTNGAYDLSRAQMECSALRAGTWTPAS